MKTVFLALLILFGSCNSPSPSPSVTPRQNILNLSFQWPVSTFHPSFASAYPSAFIVKMLFEGLMLMGPDGKMQPAIAKGYRISKDQKTYTFHLRKCKWTNGDPITAYDFEYAWKKQIDPKGDGRSVDSFFPIKNVKKMLSGKKPMYSVGIRALNERTFEVELEKPTPYFLEVISAAPFFPVNHKIDQRKKYWAEQVGEKFVCNGPFRLVKHLPNDEIVVSKNPHYWDKDSIKLAGIKILYIPDPEVRYSMFKKQQIDWLGNPLGNMSPEIFTHLKQQGKVEFFDTLGVYWYFLNTNKPPFQSKKMRQAFALAVDREQVIQSMNRGGETAALSILPRTLASSQTPFIKNNDQKKAAKLFNEALDEMGIKKKELPKITINTIESASIHRTVSKELQKQWNRVFGLNISIQELNWRFHYATIQNGDFQIGGMAWQSWIRDPSFILNTFRNKRVEQNMSNWENREYESLLIQSEMELNPILRRRLFNKAESILMEEMPAIPVFFTSISFSKNERLKGVYLSELMDVDFRWAYFD